MKEVIAQLEANKIIKPAKMFEINAYDISLAGHSGRLSCYQPDH